MKIEERLDLLKQEVQKQTFLNQKGLGNEVSFWIFDYPPEKEILVRNTVKKLVVTLGKKSITALEIDLFDLCLELIETKTDLDKVLAYEKKRGSDDLLKKLIPILKPENIRDAVKEKIDGSTQIVFLTGVGKVWPLVRSHTVLNNLQIILNVPLILFYPGGYSGTDLSLFNKFHDNNYYRAFRLISDVSSNGVGNNG
jgi:hypothetical protein